MKICINKDSVITFNEMQNLNPIIIHWIGGSYGNFLYRMMHKHLSDLPKINDDFLYTLGNSHSINDVQYFDDFLPEDFKKDLLCKFDINSRYTVIKKHCFPKIKFNKFILSKYAKLNIVVTFNNKSDAIWSYIQNVIKLDDLSDFKKFDELKPEWFLENNLAQLDNLCKIFNKMTNAIHKSWYENLENTNTICIKINEIIDCESFYNFLYRVSNLLNMSISEKNNIVKDHEIFIENQKFIQSYFRHNNKRWQETNLVDLCLKNFYY